MKVFLCGTCAESKWRDNIIPQLKCEYFNPVVDDWTPERQKIEELEKRICEWHLYVITPKMKGVFSIAEAVSDSMQLHDRCIFCVTKEDDDRDWTKEELKSLNATSDLIKNNGGIILSSLDEVVEYINNEHDRMPSIEKQLEYYKKRTEHLVRLWNKLISHIIPEGWYCMAADTWSCEEEECSECIDRLNRPFVQKLIKRKKF